MNTVARRGVALSFGAALLLAACAQFPPTTTPSTQTAFAQPLGAYKSIYSFQDKPDGQNPQARVIPFGGELYGTTTIGGRGCLGVGCGTVFKITLDGGETVIHRFSGLPDGSDPMAELTPVKQQLYGTTYTGGRQCGTRRTRNGCGTVFEIDGSGAEKVLHSFAGKSDGAYPAGPVTYVNGTLYGTASYGGVDCGGDPRDGCGTIFSIDSSGKERVLGRFSGTTGCATPSGNLVYLNGKLYGTTQRGGTFGYGCLFDITLSGKMATLYSFGAKGDASLPSGLVAMNGVLYGSASYGGKHANGAVYAVTTSGSESLIYSFKNDLRDGYRPYGRLIAVNGLLYGTTDAGGQEYTGYGVVYSISPSGDFHVLYRFKGPPDGSTPYAGITNTSAAFYGTTYYGGTGCYHYGCHGGYGTVFRIAR